MTQTQVEKLQQLLDDGYGIKCTQGPYLDGFIEAIYEVEGEGLCYSSNTYSDVPLLEVGLSEIEVYERVRNWEAL